MTTKLTPPHIFNPVPGVATNHFLPGADAVPDIHLTRVDPTDDSFGAVVDIPHRLIYHSPGGFEWGYGGSGPSDLALNILGLFVPAPEAWKYHHRYKFEVLVPMPKPGGTITAESVREWLREVWKEAPRAE